MSESDNLTIDEYASKRLFRGFKRFIKPVLTLILSISFVPNAKYRFPK